MALLQMFGLKKAPSAKQLRESLPSLHSFIDVTIKDGPKGSVCFENVGAKTFATSVLSGMVAGTSATFLYANATGRYRFSARIANVDGKHATFALPSRIETVQRFSGAQRTSVRVDTTVAMQWRYAPVGKIESPWQKAVVSDISRTGCSLTTDKLIKSGNALQIKVPLLANGESVVLSAEATRVDSIETSKRHNVGLKFTALKPEAERAILDFINRRQTDLRGRGLA